MDSQSATMSSLEIAGLTGKQHKNVIVDIENVLRQAGIEGAKFSAPFKMPSGQTAKVYNLPRLECDLVISGYSVPYRMAIIKRWHELELSKFGGLAKMPPWLSLLKLRLYQWFSNGCP